MLRIAGDLTGASGSRLVGKRGPTWLIFHCGILAMFAMNWLPAGKRFSHPVG